jgi:hypothetical protein
MLQISTLGAFAFQYQTGEESSVFDIGALNMAGVSLLIVMARFLACERRLRF